MPWRGHANQTNKKRWAHQFPDRVAARHVNTSGWISIVDGLPRLAARGQADPGFGLARRIIDCREHARTIQILRFLLISIGDGLPGLSIRGQGNHNSGLAVQTIKWRDRARTTEILNFLLFRLATGSQDSPYVVKTMPISAWLYKLSTGKTMPAQ